MNNYDELIKRLQKKASLFLSSSGADPHMKLKDVVEWKAAEAIKSLQVNSAYWENATAISIEQRGVLQARVKELGSVIERLIKDFIRGIDNLQANKPVGTSVLYDWLVKDFTESIQYARDNQSKK